MDRGALFSGLTLLAAASIGTAGGSGVGGWPPFIFLLGLVVLGISWLARRSARTPPYRRLLGLAVVALVIASLSTLGQAELVGLTLLDLVALALVFASVQVIGSSERSDARPV